MGIFAKKKRKAAGPGRGDLHRGYPLVFCLGRDWLFVSDHRPDGARALSAMAILFGAFASNLILSRVAKRA
ncbi:hypothetical protein LZ190_17280 [Rhodovulum sulfidophilum]|nr:hypothetical protein [Rhodovulum sulfidophilum]